MARRAQTSTEYLVILGVVIVLALIVVGVLGGFPAIGSGSRQRSDDIYWQQADIAITEHTFSQDPDSVYMEVRNNLPHDINLQSITIKSTAFFQGPVFIPSGGSYVINDANIETGVPCATGQQYAWDVLIVYGLDQPDSQLYYNFDGDGRKLRGECATG